MIKFFVLAVRSVNKKRDTSYSYEIVTFIEFVYFDFDLYIKFIRLLL